MKYRGIFFAAFLAFAALLPAHAERSVVNFDFDWKFQLGDTKGIQAPDFNDAAWRSVQLPHDFSIEQNPVYKRDLQDNGFFPGGIGWYRKNFTVPKAWTGKQVFITFDGVYHQSDVWLNGQHLGFHPYGYTSFEYDLTPHLNADGTNTLAVRVNHSNAASGRWYSGSGIYRHVRLRIVDAVHVDLWGSSITTPKITKEAGGVQIETTVKNTATEEQQVTLQTEIFNAAGEKVAEAESAAISLKSGATGTVKQTAVVKNPALWDIATPVLYTAVTRVKSGENSDEVRNNFGFRTIRWDVEKGFFINERNVKLKGVNLHHDGGVAVGAAVPERIWEWRLQQLKNIGVNFIRTSHNPTAPEFLDLCDRLGFLVLDEAFDKWKATGNGGYYSKYYDHWWRLDLQSMLQRDRNHPSIVLWSVGNEVYEQDRFEGAKRLEEMVAFVHAYEPTRKVTAAIAPNGTAHNRHGFADKMDISGYNYNEEFFTEERKRYPNRIYLGTENFLYYRGSGWMSNYGERKHFWKFVEETDWMAGWTVWVGIDHIGVDKSCPTGSIIWVSGFLDQSSREKPIAGLFKAFWKSEPQVHLAVLEDTLDIDTGPVQWSSPPMAAHWNFPQYRNRLIRVQTFSNCDSVELWVNKRSLGRRSLADYENNTIAWTVPYAEGVLRAVGYKAGEAVARAELRTAGKPANIDLQNVYSDVSADGQDVVLLEVFLRDKNGVVVQHDDRKVTLTVKGGVLLGLDTGDARLREPHRTNTRKTYFGRILAVVRAPKEPGDIVITASSGGLPDSTLTVSAKPKLAR
jgi:beta-galactosidase